MLFVLSKQENKFAMKQIILIVAFLFISISGFSQLAKENPSTWNNFTEKVNEKPELKIFPNPCTQQKITLELNNEELAEVRISNITGKVVLFKKYVIPINKVELALENTPDGIYLIQIKTSRGKAVAKKLIVSGN